MTRFRRQCLVQEGFAPLDDAELARLDLPLRFTPALCLSLTAVAVLTGSPVVLGLLAISAATAAATGRHPFDLVWDYLVRPAVGGPRLPQAPSPRRFAFVMATPVLSGAALGLVVGAEVIALGLAALQVAGCAAYVFGGWCAASVIHRRLWGGCPAPQVWPA